MTFEISKPIEYEGMQISAQTIVGALLTKDLSKDEAIKWIEKLILVNKVDVLDEIEAMIKDYIRLGFNINDVGAEVSRIRSKLNA